MGVSCARIDGNTSSKERERLISLFSRGRGEGEEQEGDDEEDDDEDDDDEEEEEDEEDKAPTKAAKRGAYSSTSGTEGRIGEPEASPPVFLLSTRAGGVGINLQVITMKATWRFSQISIFSSHFNSHTHQPSHM